MFDLIYYTGDRCIQTKINKVVAPFYVWNFRGDAHKLRSNTGTSWHTRPSGCIILLLRACRAQGYLSVVSVVCCQVEVSANVRSLAWEVLPTVVRHCVWSRNLSSEAALTCIGLLRQIKKNYVKLSLVTFSVKLRPRTRHEGLEEQ
jgi:hypothetical protein